ncbi:MAG: cation diffusion facilitator family transporter [Anaerorhabdus sp.]
MGDWIIRKFVKDYQNVSSDQVRSDYGKVSSYLGILVNIGLAITKSVLGFLTGSIAIISDAINNISDVANCVVALFGYKLAAKPADKDHPFGHGRVEYISSLFIAVVILLLGIELFKTSLNKIFNPSSINVNPIVILILFITVIVKLWMYFFNKKLGDLTSNKVLYATATDSLSDTLATSATIIAALSSFITDLPIDGIMGLIVSLIIINSGIGIIKDSSNELIGQSASDETLKRVEEILQESKDILGFHDLSIHNYGPGKFLGSVHVEVDSNSKFLEVHDLVDTIEQKISEELKITMTIHMDPVLANTQDIIGAQNELSAALLKIDNELSFKNFRVVVCPSKTNYIFSLEVPKKNKLSNDNLKLLIEENLSGEKVISTIIDFERA